MHIFGPVVDDDIQNNHNGLQQDKSWLEQTRCLKSSITYFNQKWSDTAGSILDIGPFC